MCGRPSKRPERNRRGTMGSIVGAAVVSHHPGLVQPKEVRVQRGNGRDSDLIEGFDRVRAKVDALKPDTFVIFDTHWLTTSMHLVAGAAHYKGKFMSDELPYSMSGFPYDFRGAPALAALVEDVAKEKKVPARNVTAPELPLHYPTINVVHLLGRGEKVLSVGTCQTAKFHHFIQMGEIVAEAIKRSDARVVLLASGAMSHLFYDLYHVPPNPRIWHPDNVSNPKNRALDREVRRPRRALRADDGRARRQGLPGKGYAIVRVRERRRYRQRSRLVRPVAT